MLEKWADFLHKFFAKYAEAMDHFEQDDADELSLTAALLTELRWLHTELYKGTDKGLTELRRICQFSEEDGAKKSENLRESSRGSILNSEASQASPSPAPAAITGEAEKFAGDAFCASQFVHKQPSVDLIYYENHDVNLSVFRAALGVTWGNQHFPDALPEERQRNATWCELASFLPFNSYVLLEVDAGHVEGGRTVPVVNVFAHTIPAGISAYLHPEKTNWKPSLVEGGIPLQELYCRLGVAGQAGRRPPRRTQEEDRQSRESRVGNASLGIGSAIDGWRAMDLWRKRPIARGK